MPREAPSSSAVSLAPPPTPSSDSGKEPMTVSVAGDTLRPIAKPSSSSGARKSVYVEPDSIRVSSRTPAVPIAMPVPTTRFTPSLGASRPVTADPAKTAPASGSSRTPVSSAL